MSSYLPPSDNLPSFNPSVFQSSLTDEEVESKIKTLETDMTEITSSVSGITSGINEDGTHTGTQTFGITYTSAPVVNCQVISSSGNNAFIINVYNVTTTDFKYKKFYAQESSDTVHDSTHEDFYWIAIGNI